MSRDPVDDCLLWAHFSPTALEAGCAAASLNRVLHELEEESDVQIWPQYVDDPVGFFRNVLGDDPWSSERDDHAIPEDVRDLILKDPPCGQTDVLQGVADLTYIAIAGSKGPGKTWLLGRIILWWLHTRPGSIVITVATSGTQVKGQVWGELEEALQDSDVPLLGRLTLGGNPQYKLGPKHYAIGLSPKKKETLQGWHAKAEKDGIGGPVLIIFDEASGVDDNLIDAGFGCTTNPGSKMVLASNFTKAHGAFHDLYFPPFADHFTEQLSAETKKRQAKLGLFSTFRMTYFDVPKWIVREDFEPDMRKRCPGAPRADTEYRKDVLCLPPMGATDLAFPRDLLIRTSESRPTYGGLHMGVDIGRQGSDPCVATLWDNGVTVSTARWSDENPYDTIQTATKIAVLAQGARALDSTKPMGGWGVPWENVHLDATEGSLGVGVADVMWGRGHAVDPVSFSTKPDELAVAWWSAHFGREVPDFPNNRQFLYWIARHALIHGSASIPFIPEFAPLYDQLTKIPREGDGDKFRIPKKDKLIEAIGHSPDDADSWVLCFSRQDAAAVRLRSLEPASKRKARSRSRAATLQRRRARRG